MIGALAQMKKTLVLLLAVVGCQANTVGNSCTVDRDCDRGQTCMLDGFPGGFCSKGCVQEGATTDCPAGTICTRTSGPNPAIFCGNSCTEDAQCRGGAYLCRAITNSAEKACAP